MTPLEPDLQARNATTLACLACVTLGIVLGVVASFVAIAMCLE